MRCGNALKAAKLAATLLGRMSTTPPAVPVPAADLPRRMNWRLAGMLTFLGVLAALAVLAILALLAPIHSVTGLPDDPRVRAARDAVAGRVRVPTGDLRFESALLGGAPAARIGPAERAAIARANRLLESARLAAIADSRIPAFQGHLALALRRYPDAERLYRQAIDLSAHTSEARLGLGIVLALEAEHTRDQRDAHALELMAIAQFAAVRRDAPEHAAALYDRALLLARVGRMAEARRFAREYQAADSTSAWAERLRRETAER